MYIGPEMELQIKELIESNCTGYKVVGKIGSGGFSKVYEIKKEYGVGARAVKVVLCDHDPALDHKVTEEITLQNKMGDIREVVTLYDNHMVDMKDGKTLHIIVLDLMEGSVRDLLKSKQEAEGSDKCARLETKEAVSIAINVCNALEEMEEERGDRIVHGDIKPENILYQTNRGRRNYKLSDFGCVYDINKTQTSWAGTEKYSIPGDWHHTRDIYAIGITLMEMLGEPCPSLPERIGDEPLWSCTDYKVVPETLVEICRKATARVISARYQSAAELKKELKNWLDAKIKEEEQHKNALKRVRELVKQIGEEDNIFVQQEMLHEVDALSRELLEKATEQEKGELDELMQACKIYAEKIELETKLMKADALVQTEDYHNCLEAVKIYSELSSSHNVSERIYGTASKIELLVNSYVKTLELQNEELKRCIQLQKEQEEARQRLARFEPGKRLTFGRYPQTAEGTDQTPIEWRVLKNEGDKVLLVTEQAIDCKRYHSVLKDITWVDCDLRNWLNEAFIKNAFSEQ